MKKNLCYSCLIIFCLFNTTVLFGQFGGKQSFDFLDLPKNAHLAAIGGFSNSITSDDATFFLANPAALDSISPLALSFGHQFYFAGTNHTVFAATIPVKNLGDFGLGFENMSFGEFDGFDAVGNPTTGYKAFENAITIGKSHLQGPFSLGVNMKMAFSAIENFRSSALLFDIGGIFKPTPSTSIGLKAENIGTFISSYSGTDNSTLPFDINISASVKPEHMPVRFHLTADQFIVKNTRYENGDASSSPFDFFRFGTEILLSKVIELRAGYNFGTRRELRLNQTSGGAGLGFGFLIRLKKASFSFSRSYYHVSGGTTFITLSTNANYFKKGI